MRCNHPFLSNASATAGLSLMLLSGVAGAAPNAPAPPSTPATLATVPHPHAYGILIGTNVGGAGQKPLRYAEADAQRMAQVLRELGRYGAADMRVLLQPDPAKVFATVDEVAAKMRAHRDKGEEAILVFYYSGHARANAFSLASEELSIATLRDKLRQVPSTLTLVVLDACQSGQFARTKGAEPAADFSYNSVSHLTTKGTVVMASSSARELSQESDHLRSSFFTHHLVAGLRGAADADGDGRVSLDEAYRYAYRRTLASTAQTQVGSQHVTLETDLAGQGDLALTYPADARSQLELPGPLEARVLVQHQPSGSVIAEVQKVKGAPLRLALVSGSYDAFVREGTGARRLHCKVSLVDERVSVLDLGRCANVSAASFPKGDGPGDEPSTRADPPEGAPPAWRSDPIEPWNVELGLGFMGRNDGPYTRRLEEFGYETTLWFGVPIPRLSLAVRHGVLPNISVGVLGTTLGGDTYERHVTGSNDSFSFSAAGLGAFARASTAIAGSTAPHRSAFEIYGQMSAGLTYGTTELTTGAGSNGPPATSSETYWGGMIGGAGGIAGVFPHWGLFLQAGYDYAPTVKNLLGDVHDAGGLSVQLGARVRFGQ